MMDLDYDAVIESAQDAIDITLDNANKEDSDNETEASTDVEDSALDAIIGGGEEGIFISDKDIDDIDAGRSPKEYDPVEKDSRAAEQDSQIKELSKDVESDSIITKDDIKDIKEGASVYDVMSDILSESKDEFFNLDSPAKPALSHAIQHDEYCHCSQCDSGVDYNGDIPGGKIEDTDEVEIDYVTDDEPDDDIDPLSTTSKDIKDTVKNEPPGPVIPLSDQKDGESSNYLEGDVNNMFDEDFDFDDIESHEHFNLEAASNDHKSFLNDQQIENIGAVKLDSIGIENDFEGSSVNAKQKSQGILLGMDSNIDEDDLNDVGFTDIYGGNSEYTVTKKDFFNLEDDSAKCMHKQ